VVEFGSTVDALRCASKVQAQIAERNAVAVPEDRISIHQGDIVVEDGDIFGDGVNIAACLEGLAPPGGVCVSARVQEDVAGKIDLRFEDLPQPRAPVSATRSHEQQGVASESERQPISFTINCASRADNLLRPCGGERRFGHSTRGMAAVLGAGGAGRSRLIGADEEGSLARAIMAGGRSRLNPRRLIVMGARLGTIR